MSAGNEIGMIISHKHRYVFIELPRTGCTAVGKELIEKYDGENILHKHATYREFKKIYPDLVEDYFSFSSIRNPLDSIVSLYEKIRNGYYDFMLNPERKKSLYHHFYLLPRLRYVKMYNPDFERYFQKYYIIPYDNWSVLDHDSFDAIIRFESLNKDFMNVLSDIGIKPVRDLPVTNKTREKARHFEEYYTKPIQKRAVFVFGPFMKRWKYNFPDSFNNTEISIKSCVFHYMINLIKKFYWIHLKTNF